MLGASAAVVALGARDEPGDEKWFRLDGANGEVVRVSAMLMGLSEFARVVLQKVSGSSIDPAARPILEQTAAGSPLSIWG